MTRKRHPVEIAPRTLTRRTWMEWVGKSTVLSLGSLLAARCGVEPGAETDGGAGADGGIDGGHADASADGAVFDGGPDASQQPLCPDPAQGFPFEPGTLPDFSHWAVRTVDPQDLSWILQNWRLTVDGLVDTPRSLSFDDLLCLDRVDQVTDFHCVEGWSVYDVPWNGVHLQSLLDAVGGARSGATHVTFHTIDGVYNESLPLDIALEPKTLLGYGVGGRTLPLKHGFPLRVVVPRLQGYKSAKYLHRIELTDHPIEGFWVQLGYPYGGEVPEGRLRPGKY